jgi:hypothetical protein
MDRVLPRKREEAEFEKKSHTLTHRKMKKRIERYFIKKRKQRK